MPIGVWRYLVSNSHQCWTQLLPDTLDAPAHFIIYLRIVPLPVYHVLFGAVFASVTTLITLNWEVIQ